MNQEKMNNKNTILYVDDEEKALKYFQKVVGKDHDVVIATSVDEGWKIVEERAGEIAVLISDQRMPGKSGVELLSLVRKNYPKTVRILTTAYSDLDSAIDAVNDGAIYQYIVKPWDLRELRANLRRAMDFYLLQRERDMLMRQKLSVLQRMIITDRVQSLTVFATAIERNVEGSLAALSAFIDFLPRQIQDTWTQSIVTQSHHHWQDLGALAKEESRLTLEMIKRMGGLTESMSSCSFAETRIESVVEKVIEPFRRELAGFECEWKPDLPTVMLSEKFFVNGLRKLVESFFAFFESKTHFKFAADVIERSGGLRFLTLDFFAEGEKVIDASMLSRLFSVLNEKQPSDVSLNLLQTFFIVYHHRGTLRLDFSNAKGVRFEICLPLNRDDAPEAVQEETCLEKLLTHFDRWDAVFL